MKLKAKIMTNKTTTAPAELPTYFLKTDEIIANLKGLIRYARKGTRRRLRLDQAIMDIGSDLLMPPSDQAVLETIRGLRNTSGPAEWASAVDDVILGIRRHISSLTFDDLKKGDEVYFVNSMGQARTGEVQLVQKDRDRFLLARRGFYTRSFFANVHGYRTKKADAATPSLTQKEAISALKDTIEQAAKEHCEAPIAKPAEKTDPVFLDLRPGDMVSLRPDRTKDCKDFVVRHVGHTKNVRLITVEDSDDDQNIANLTMGRWMAWEGKKSDAAFTMSKADAHIKPEHLFDMLQVGDEISVNGRTGKVHTISYFSGRTTPFTVSILRDEGGFQAFTLETFVKGNGRLISKDSNPAEGNADPQAEKKPITIDGNGRITKKAEGPEKHLRTNDLRERLHAILPPAAKQSKAGVCVHLALIYADRNGDIGYPRAAAIGALLLRCFEFADAKASSEILTLVNDIAAYLPDGQKDFFGPDATAFISEVKHAHSLLSQLRS